jgi:hypothetical protein
LTHPAGGSRPRTRTALCGAPTRPRANPQHTRRNTQRNTPTAIYIGSVALMPAKPPQVVAQRHRVEQPRSRSRRRSPVARTVPARETAIWQLNVAAQSVLEVAEAAERAWLRAERTRTYIGGKAASEP